MARFEKGNSKGGRTKGSKNKNTQAIRDAYQLLIEEALPKLKEDLNSLDPKERLRMIIDLSGYVIPKLKAIESTFAGKEDITIDFNDGKEVINILPVEWVE